MKKNKLKFFIVDDDPFSVAIFRQYLIFEGYRDIEIFSNGEDCLEKLDEEPDVILLDHYMTTLNGMEVLKEVKKRKPGTYVLYISSSTDTELIEDSLKHGAFCYIVKGKNEFEKMLAELRKIKTAIDSFAQTNFTKMAFYPLSYNRNNFSFSFS